MFKTIDEIKTAVAAGHTVCWRNLGYQVLMNWQGQAQIRCNFTSYMTPLTESHHATDFFISLPADPWDLVAGENDLLDDWKAEVAADETRLGYLEWKHNQEETQCI